MAQQLQELLLKVSGQLQVVERELERLDEAQKDTQAEQTRILVELAALKQDEKWTGEERRKVAGRLETGDHTFQKLQHEVADAGRIARWCRDQLEKKETTGQSRKKKFLWKLLEHAAPLIAGFLFWLLYHLLLVGPKIAEAMKQTGGHP